MPPKGASIRPSARGGSGALGAGTGTGCGEGVGDGVGGGGKAIASRAAAKTSGLTRSWFVTTAMLKPESGR
jgi:hypothetical protein